MKCWCCALVEAEVEHLDDVRVHEPGGGQRLAAEAGDERRVVGQVLGQQLDRHVALEALVEGQLHGRHAADAEAALDPVPPGDRRSVGHPPPPCPLLFPLPGPVPPLLPLPLSVVVPAAESRATGRRRSSTRSGAAWLRCVDGGRTSTWSWSAWSCVVDVVVVVRRCRGGRRGGRRWWTACVGVCWRQSLRGQLARSCSAPWLRLRRSVGLTVTGRFWTSLVAGPRWR